MQTIADNLLIILAALAALVALAVILPRLVAGRRIISRMGLTGREKLLLAGLVVLTVLLYPLCQYVVLYR